MRPARWVLKSAMLMGLIATLLGANSARAQFYDDASGMLGLSLDPIGRSPRLLGLGGMSLVMDDPHYRLTLWDFAGNPIGLMDEDSLSTLELRPGTASTSSFHNLGVMGEGREREDLAARENRLGFEGWRRSAGSATYGLIGSLNLLRYDQPWSGDVEQRSNISQPNAMPILNGPLPYFGGGRVKYALRFEYSGETVSDRYRTMLMNAEGDYISQDGITQLPPDMLTPVDYTISSTGAGGALSYDFGKWLTAAVAVDGVGRDIKGTNNGDRYASERHEQRPYGIGQTTLVGHIGRELEWIADGRAWKASSEQTWAFTVSAGLGALPLTGRGKLLEREEEGNTLRARARWVHGSWELGGAFNTGFRKITITPPGVNDYTSFNFFRNQLFNRTGADSLVLADSVIANQSEERQIGAGGGISWKFPNRRGAVGAEYHWQRDLFQQTTNGLGPRPRSWKVRTGLEYRCNRVLTGRAGYAYGNENRDQLTADNQYIGHTVTLGAGLQPVGAMWSLETGYAVEWLHADYGDPSVPHSSRQQLVSQIRWVF